MRILLLPGVVVCAVAVLVSIISTAIPYWIYKHDAFGTYYQGLFRTCVRLHTVTPCSAYDSGIVEQEGSIHASDLMIIFALFHTQLPDWLVVVQAFMISGILLLVLGTFFGRQQLKYESRQIFVVSVITTICGGLLHFIAVLIYGMNEKYFSIAFYLAIASGMLALLSALLISLSKLGAAGYSSI